MRQKFIAFSLSVYMDWMADGLSHYLLTSTE